MSEQSAKAIRQSLRTAKNSAEALNRLYTLHKKANAKYSLAFFCQRAGFASKGYLSEVIRGKKKINPKHAGQVASAFFLKGIEAKYFKLLVEIDAENSAEVLKDLKLKKQTLQKSLLVVRSTMPSAFPNPFFVLSVYSALGLQNNQADLSKLLHYFGQTKRRELQEALHLLKESKLVTEKDGIFRSLHAEVIFSENEHNFSHLNFLESALDRTKESLKQWYDQPDAAYIESSIISVNKETYKRLLPKIREFAAEIQSQLETDDADQLVLFNWNMFPLGN
jgi:uncharacterized protein (TIGR02147 family)